MILNLYKPRGISSFNFINREKRIQGWKKVGHAGTLDPLAEGVLIVLTDADTKRQDEFMKQDKIYVAEILFGAYSESFDLEKDLTYDLIPPVFSENTLLETLTNLIGTLSLPAPIYSAKSVGGKRLYKMAKQGISPFELPTVTSTISDIKLLENTQIELVGKLYPLIKLEISCSSGTYIRSIANHLGEKLGTKGVLYSLIRTKVDLFNASDSQKPALNTV
jgi:tRNA pseudouridine55 synthase